MKIKDLITHLQGYPDDMPVAYSIFGPDDVRAVAKERGISHLTDEQVEYALGHVNTDPEVGISYLSLEFAIEHALDVWPKD
jgi:hypothetical protein